jgi:hypothetical protein
MYDRDPAQQYVEKPIGNKRLFRYLLTLLDMYDWDPVLQHVKKSVGNVKVQAQLQSQCRPPTALQ